MKAEEEQAIAEWKLRRNEKMKRAIDIRMKKQLEPFAKALDKWLEEKKNV